MANLGRASTSPFDDLTYSDQGEWAAREHLGDGEGWTWNGDHDGGGRSLELILPLVSNKHGQNWSASQGSPTPGAANSTGAAEIAPLILDVAHDPVVPKSNEPVRITARLLDVDGTSLNALLFWRAAPRDPGSFSALAMVDDGNHGDGDAGDGVFGATLPAMADGTTVEFYVFASDGNGTRTWPPATNIGQVANAHYIVDDEIFEGHWPIYRIVMTGDEDNAFENVNRSSNERFHATLILDDCSGPVIRYNSSVRVRGASSRGHNPPPMRVSVPHDNRWKGRSGMNWNTKYTYSQYIGMRLFQGAGLAAPDAKPARVRWNGEDRMRDDAFDYWFAVHMEALDGDFIDDKFPEDSEGNLYKKVRPDRDWAWRDGDVGDYLSDGWTKETNEDENDWSDLDGWLGVMNNAPGAGNYVTQVEAVVDLDQWLRWFATMAIIANGETNASNGADDDYSVYSGATDGRFLFLPHDLDTILGNGDGSRIEDPEHTIFDMISRGDVLDPLVPLFSDPGVQVRYYQALRELLQGTFSKPEFDELIDNSLTGWVPQNRIDDIKSFMDARRTYITGLVDSELGPPPPPPAATTSATLIATHGSLMISEVFASNTELEYFGTFPDYVRNLQCRGRRRRPQRLRGDGRSRRSLQIRIPRWHHDQFRPTPARVWLVRSGDPGYAPRLWYRRERGLDLSDRRRERRRQRQLRAASREPFDRARRCRAEHVAAGAADPGHGKLRPAGRRPERPAPQRMAEPARNCVRARFHRDLQPLRATGRARRARDQ